MDDIDRKILSILSENSVATATEMMSQVNLSIPAINKRIQKLQSSGVIQKFTVLIDPAKIGKPIIAYILVVLQQGAKVETIMDFVRSDPDILECSGVTGEYDYIMKVCAADVPSLQKKINSLKRSAGVVKSHTMLSLTEYKYEVAAQPDA